MNKTGVTQKAVIFNNEGKVLAIKRTKTAPSSAGKWDFPGGALEFGEEPREGIKREVKEETGLNIVNLEPFEVWSKVNSKLGDFWVTIAYTAKVKTNKVKLSFEHNNFRWVSLSDFLKLSSPQKLRYFVKKLKLTRKQQKGKLN